MKFILTSELGRLAKWLRIMGFDAEYFTEDKKGRLIIRSLREERVIITRSSALSRFSGVRMVRVKSDFVEEQIRQIIKELGISPDAGRFFRRCVICNVELGRLTREDAQGRVPEYVLKTQDFFMGCPLCKRAYWQGTHWTNVQNFIKGL